MCMHLSGSGSFSIWPQGLRMDGRGGELLPPKTNRHLSLSLSVSLRTDEITPTRETHFGGPRLRFGWNHEIISR